MDTKAAPLLTPLLTDEVDAALLRELLLDSASPRASGGRADDASAVALAHASPGASPRRSSSRHAKRPARKRLNEPKLEIERLRREASELQDEVALLTRRAQNRAGSQSSGVPVARGDALAVWKSVAARQFQLLRATERNNLQLREQVEHQRSIVQGLVRLIQRAQNNHSGEGIPRALPLVDAARLAQKRRELLLTVSSVFRSLQSEQWEQFSHLPRDEEFRGTQSSIPHDDPNVPPGMMLTQSHAKRLVQSERSCLFDRLWTLTQSTAISYDRYDLQHVDHSGNDLFVAFSKTFPHPLGQALFHGVGMHAHFRTDSQDVLVAVGSFWPDDSAPSHLQHSGFDLQMWTVAQPLAGSENVNEVLTRIECSRMATSKSSEALTRQQASELEAIAGESHKLLLDQNDKWIDDFMLG